METNAMVQECETTVRKKITLKSGFMVNRGSEQAERNQILWFLLIFLATAFGTSTKNKFKES